MAHMLGSMVARNGSPTVCREPCQPIRTCTSQSTHCPSGRPVGPSIARRSSRMLKTTTGDTRDIQRELREQIAFPRHAQLSLLLYADGGQQTRKRTREG